MEALVSLFVLGIIISYSMSLSLDVARTQQELLVQSGLESLSKALVSNITNDRAWDKTKALNEKMACARKSPFTCAPKLTELVSVYSSEGKKIVDSENPLQGFRLDGSQCLSYGQDGSDGCVFRAMVRWTIECTTPTTCKYPDEAFEINYLYNGKGDRFDSHKHRVLKMSRSNQGAEQSPMIACIDKDLVYVGFNKKIVSGDGQTHNSDEDGCVTLNAFKGVTGPEGPMGPAGPPGVPAEVLAGGGGEESPTGSCDPNKYVSRTYSGYMYGSAKSQCPSSHPKGTVNPTFRTTCVLHPNGQYVEDREWVSDDFSTCHRLIACPDSAKYYDSCEFVDPKTGIGQIRRYESVVTCDEYIGGRKTIFVNVLRASNGVNIGQSCTVK